MATFEVQLQQHVTRYRTVVVEAASEEAAKRRASLLAKGYALPQDGEDAGEWEGAAGARVTFRGVKPA